MQGRKIGSPESKSCCFEESDQGILLDEMTVLVRPGGGERIRQPHGAEGTISVKALR